MKHDINKMQLYFGIAGAISAHCKVAYRFSKLSGSKIHLLPLYLNAGPARKGNSATTTG